MRHNTTNNNNKHYENWSKNLCLGGEKHIFALILQHTFLNNILHHSEIHLTFFPLFLPNFQLDKKIDKDGYKSFDIASLILIVEGELRVRAVSLDDGAVRLLDSGVAGTPVAVE